MTGFETGKGQMRALAERLCRPQRLGIFGRRAVGKTTLMATLYREAVAGRLPGLRLAAADARTADYLSDKLLQLESGQPVPGTLAETELRFHLYHDGGRLELLVLDYQGEHVELGKEEPVREFLAGCDAVWLCVEAPLLTRAPDRLRAEQEIEQLLEDVLALGPRHAARCPVALVLTKADLLAAPDWAESLAMTRHSLATHFPRQGHFAVSCLARDGDALRLEPRRLDEPLTWLLGKLREQDAARLEELWSLADATVLQRAVYSFTQRYPQSPESARYARRLAATRRRVLARRGLAGVTAAAALGLGLWAYDALGYRQAQQFEADYAHDPAAVLRQWEEYRRWHPTRNLILAATHRGERRRLEELEREARRQEYDHGVAELRRLANDPDANAEAVWARFQDVRTRYPGLADAAELEALQAPLKERRDAQRNLRAQQTYDDLLRREGQAEELAALLVHADRFLQDYADTSLAGAVRERRDAYLARLDENDIQPARDYSARSPFNFQTRREHYLRYLTKHPSGRFAAEAEAALKAIAADWDRHDFRLVRDHFLSKPAEVPDLVAHCRAYLAAHPDGRFTASAKELLRWSERVTAPHEYKVVLRSGYFDPSVARWFSRGPDLSVEVEVAGVRYGPSNIVANRYDPVWGYEFPRPIRWRLGDPVVIRVTDHDYKKRVVLEVASAPGDPLAMRWLSGETWSGKNHLHFASDFALPTLPEVE